MELFRPLEPRFSRLDLPNRLGRRLGGVGVVDPLEEEPLLLLPDDAVLPLPAVPEDEPPEEELPVELLADPLDALPEELVPPEFDVLAVLPVLPALPDEPVPVFVPVLAVVPDVPVLREPVELVVDDDAVLPDEAEPELEEALPVRLLPCEDALDDAGVDAVEDPDEAAVPEPPRLLPEVEVFVSAVFFLNARIGRAKRTPPKRVIKE